MTSNKSYKITPELIVYKDLSFRIPLYQRLFTWGESQVIQLMEDLQTHFKKREEKAYYLGMITVVEHGINLPVLDLIDGQQRTTVIMLLAIGFMNVLPECEAKQKWSTLFDSSNRVFFIGRSDDSDYLLNLLSKGKKTSYENINMSYENINMKEGLSCIVKYLRTYFDETELKDFADAVFERLTLFVTELPDHYVKNPTSLNEYFEAMNSSGKSLEQHEILKVELLRDYTGPDKLSLTRLWNAVSNFEQPLIKLEDINNARKVQCESYRRSIKQCKTGNFEEACQRYDYESKIEGTNLQIAEIELKKYDFSKKPFRDKEDGIMSFPEFLLLVLALHTGKDELARVHPTKLHNTFKDNPIPQDEIAYFYHELYMYRLLLDMYVVRLKYSSSSSTHTLIIKEEDREEKEEHQRLRQFQSMLDVSTEAHVWVLPLLRYIKSIDHEPTQMELLKFLMSKDLNRSGHSECPDLNSLDYDAKPRYWFFRLDYALWEKLILDGKDAFRLSESLEPEPEAIRQYEFRNNRSIEHLHPQNQDNNESWSREDVNSFGNLAMISAGFNSQQSNLPVHVKFANLEVQIGSKNLQSIKLYFMYLKAKGNDAGWTIKAKGEHAEEMLTILKESIEKVKAYGQQ